MVNDFFVNDSYDDMHIEHRLIGTTMSIEVNGVISINVLLEVFPSVVLFVLVVDCNMPLLVRESVSEIDVVVNDVYVADVRVIVPDIGDHSIFPYQGFVLHHLLLNYNVFHFVWFDEEHVQILAGVDICIDVISGVIMVIIDRD